MRTALRVLLAVALVLSVVGAAVFAMLLPAYTRVLVDRVGSAERVGLSAVETAYLAEEVRAYVAGRPGATLPAHVADGRVAFDERAVSHLDDVRDVLILARWATLASGLLALGGLGGLAAKGSPCIGGVLCWSGRALAVLVVVALAMALGDFEWFFAAFHGLFFEAGTWMFSPGSLLIGLFPEPFWMVSGAVWAGLVLLGGGALEVSGRLSRARCQTRPVDSGT